ncbi:MAG: J domain-containing protein [Candidatus Rokubacteria bacterium]|nr:J domain-containing protein [Candidatus Rokubacteria bacterium]
MRRDYYAVLGIVATAGPREIRQAYRRLARQYSPDVNFWDQQARTLFAEIAEAYRVLSDPHARAMYDRFGHGVHRAEPLEVGRRGEDVHVAVELGFAEVARGVTVGLEVTRFSPCPACGAAGGAAGEACSVCLGRGVRRSIDPVPVSIPAGVDTGAQIRVAGAGSAGPFGGPRGDLIVSTRVREHPFFKRKGDSVHSEVPISVWEALRGARIRMPTPLAESVLVIPPGTTGGQVFRLRGQGLPKLTGDGVGDLYVTIRVMIPGGLDARTDELVRELERLMPTEPRAGLDRYKGGAA